MPVITNVGGRVEPNKAGAAPSILYVDDERANLDLFRRSFDETFTLHTASSGPEALEILEKEPDIGVLISDQRMDPMTGIELLAASEEHWPLLTRMLLTAFSDSGLLLQAIRRGHVHDYVTKPWQADDVALRLRAGLDAHTRRREMAALATERQLQRSVPGAGTMVGLDGGLRAIGTAIRHVAQTSTTVIIRGETGTGKELVAHAIHDQSPRARGPFIAVNCGAFPENSIEAELFGVGGKVYTDVRERPGRFEQANGGTIFLDEIGEMPATAQVRLNRVLEQRVVERLGTTRPITLNVRVIAATHRNLREMVAAGTFRADVLERLDVFRIEMPPLRQRPDDIDALARHFLGVFNVELNKHLTISGDAIQVLRAHPWPGNVRELRNAMERAMVGTRADGVLEPEDFDLDPVAMANASQPPDPGKKGWIEQRRAYLNRLMDECRWRVAVAARREGVPRTTLSDELRRLGLT
jgi:DNA-binding NtrC family response regulator